MPKKGKSGVLKNHVHCSSCCHGAGDEGKWDDAKEGEGISLVVVHTAHIP